MGKLKSMNYSPIFKFSPDAGLFFTSLFCFSDYGTGPSVFFLENGRWEFWYREDWEKSLAKQGLEFFLDPKKFSEYKEEVLKNSDIWAQSWSEFGDDLDALSKEEFLAFFEKITGELVQFFSLYHYTEFYFYDLIDERIKSAVENADKDNFNENIAILLRHDKDQNKFFEEKFAKYKKIFYPDEPIEQNFSNDSADGVVQKELEDRLGLNDDVKQLLKVVREMQGLKYFFRLFLNKSIFGNDSIRQRLEETAGKWLKIPSETVDLMFIDEIKKALKANDFNRDIIQQREGRYAVRLENHIYQIFTDENVSSIINQTRLVESEKIKGMVANRGQAEGKAKVIKLTTKTDLLGKEIEIMEEGQVLVADTTGPELIIACKKASAIVTNEGGITSHAAIVSRELNIPCIIGTKHATDIIKDGDLLKVDAFSGIVEVVK